MTLTCPYCRKPMRLSDDDIMHMGTALAARKAAAGRKPVMRKCPKCGKQHSARAMRKCKG